MHRRLAAIAALLASFLITASGAVYEVGVGQPYATLAALPALQPGDIVEIGPGTHHEVKRWQWSGTATAPITIRGIGTARPVIDATGLNVTGASPNPRAVFQVEASHVVIQHLELRNARNGDNGSGVRVTGGASDVVIRDCRIHDNDMGMQSDNNDLLLIDGCEIDHNGTASYSGASHNLYLNGQRTTIRGCWIHDATYGQNVKYRGHYLELLYNRIEDSQDGEIGIVDGGALTSQANSNAVLIGNVVVSKDRGTAWNGMRFIHYGQDMGGTRVGTLYAYGNTFVAGTARIAFLWTNVASAAVVARDNVLVGSPTIALAAGSVSGANNWVQTGATIPSGFAASVVGADPGFVAAATRDFHLRAGSACIDRGTASLTATNGSGTAFDGTPRSTFEALGNLRARPVVGALDIGAYEYGTAVGVAKVTLSVDNQYTNLYVNGGALTPGANAANWKVADTYSVSGPVSTVAVRAVNVEAGVGWAGFLAKVTEPDGSVIVSNTGWKVFSGTPANDANGRAWYDPSYDDSKWPAATSGGTYGVAPWGTQAGLSGMSGAQWIWFGKLATGVSPVYLRLTIAQPPVGNG